MWVIVFRDEVVIGPFDTEGEAITYGKTLTKAWKVRQICSPVVLAS